MELVIQHATMVIFAILLAIGTMLEALLEQMRGNAVAADHARKLAGLFTIASLVMGWYFI